MIKQPYLVALLRRSENQKTPLVVFPHEVEVLKALHGEESVIETDDVPPIKTGEIDPETEYARLEGLYIGNDQCPQPVQQALGDIDEFIASLKKSPKVKETGGDDLGELSPELVALKKHLEGLEAAELREMCKEAGLKVANTMGKDRLIEKLLINAKEKKTKPE